MDKLERILDYTLIGKSYVITAAEQTSLDDNPTYLNTDWEKSCFSNLHGNIRKYYGRKQRRRCGYCRVLISPDGYSNPIEHIMPRIKKPQWMHVPYNLVVSCAGCNSSKGSDNTMRQHENNYGHTPNHCPTVSQEYKIFNPHFDRWSDHFTIEDGFFLVPKPDSKGPDTFKFCNMHRYTIIIDYRDTLNVREQISFNTITQRIRKEKDLIKKEHLELAKNYILEMIEDN